MTATELLLTGLSSYRLTRLITKDSILDGPRNRLIARFPDEETVIGTLAVCRFCAGFHISALTLAAWRYGPRWLRFFVAAFAVAGAQALFGSAEEAWSK